MAEQSVEELSVGDDAPDFELKGTDGQTYTLESFSEYDGVVLVFTCNHCPYAKAKFDVMNQLAADYDRVAVVGINPNDAESYPEDSYDQMVALVDDGTIQWDAYLRDESQEVAKAYGAICTPDPFLLGNAGDSFEVAWHGRLDDALNPDAEPTQHDMREAIDSLLAGEPIDMEFRPSRGCSIKWSS